MEIIIMFLGRSPCALHRVRNTLTYNYYRRINHPVVIFRGPRLCYRITATKYLRPKAVARALGDPRGYYHSSKSSLYYYYVFLWDRIRVGAHLCSDVRIRSGRFYFVYNYNVYMFYSVHLIMIALRSHCKMCTLRSFSSVVILLYRQVTIRFCVLSLWIK